MQIHSSVRFAAATLILAVATFVNLDSSAVAKDSHQPEQQPKNPRLVNMPANRWLLLHKQHKGDEVVFQRQAHGGSCFDSNRGRLILFGSNTHGRNFHNSPFLFDPAAETWSRLYPDDPRETYQVTPEGIPVAGREEKHPWAMHTFGALVFDARRDELINTCLPGHMVPGRFTNMAADLWPRIKQHPTWVLNRKTNVWSALPCKPVGFFPTCAVFDTDRNVVLGFKGDGIYELSGQPRTWKRVRKKVYLAGWHQNAVYDSTQKAMVVFGHQTDRNDIEAYWPENGEHRLMPTAGLRPPKDQHNPMAFLPKLGKTLVIVDRKENPQQRRSPSVGESWLYDLGKDRWTQIPTATLPRGCGMNYTMEYDPHHDCVLLVDGGRGAGDPTVVYALRIDETSTTEK